MHYDLLLQPQQPPAPLDVGGFAAFAAREQLARRGDGAWLVRLHSTDVEVSEVREAGVTTSMQVRVPVSDRTEVLDAAVVWSLDAAGALSLRVLDPQLNMVLIGPSSATSDEFLRLARYAGEFLGVADAIGATSLAQQAPAVSATSRVLGALVVFFVVLYLSFSFFTRSRPPPEPARGPPNSKLNE